MMETVKLVFKCIVFPLLFSACSHSIEGGFTTCPIKASATDEIQAELELTVVPLDSVYTSYEFFSGTYMNQNLYLFDRFFCYVYVFNPDGTLAGRFAGLGRGPGEIVIKGSNSCSENGHGTFLVVGSTWDFATVDIENNKSAYKRLPYNPDYNGTAENFSNYSYPFNNFNSFLIGDEVYMNMDSQHPRFNYLQTTEKFLNQARHVAKINLKTGKTQMLMTGFPKIYHSDSYKYYAQSLVNLFVNDDRTMIVNFEADSTIFICDTEGIPIRGFGRSGKRMDTDYSEVRTVEDQEQYYTNRNEKGYYGHLYYDEDNYRIFRSYVRGSSSADDGLQIYENEILVADVTVPPGFIVTGRIGDYYYSNILTLDDGSLIVYKFRI